MQSLPRLPKQAPFAIFLVTLGLLVTVLIFLVRVEISHLSGAGTGAPAKANVIIPPLPKEKFVDPKKFLVTKDNEILLDVPYVNQYYDLPDEEKPRISFTACGPTSLTMAFLDEGETTDLISVINQLPRDVYIPGRAFYNLPKGATIYGFKSVTVDQTPTGFYNALKDGHPVITNVQNFNGFGGHAIVVVGIKGYKDGRADSLLVHDPYWGPNREFAFVDRQNLMQPEGYLNPIGWVQPFFIEKA